MSMSLAFSRHSWFLGFICIIHVALVPSSSPLLWTVSCEQIPGSLSLLSAVRLCLLFNPGVSAAANVLAHVSAHWVFLARSRSNPLDTQLPPSWAFWVTHATKVTGVRPSSPYLIKAFILII